MTHNKCPCCEAGNEPKPKRHIPLTDINGVPTGETLILTEEDYQKLLKMPGDKNAIFHEGIYRGHRKVEAGTCTDPGETPGYPQETV